MCTTSLSISIEKQTRNKMLDKAHSYKKIHIINGVQCQKYSDLTEECLMWNINSATTYTDAD